MSELVTRAQVILLARTLHVSPHRLAHLERLGADQLADLQQRMAAVIFDDHAETFRRISKLVPFIPLSISMPLVQRIVPPMMTGRAAGAVGADHPKKASEVLSLLRTSYVADCAQYLDPDTVGMLADVAPIDAVLEIVNEVLRRRDYVTAGPFLAAATPRLIAAVERGVPDDEGLIFSAAFAYSGEAISMIVRQLLAGPAQRVPRMVRAVLAGAPDLQAAALSVFGRCEPNVVSEVGDILFGEGSAAAIGSLIVNATRSGVTIELLAFTGRLSPVALDRMATNSVFSDRNTLTALVGVLRPDTVSGVWRGLLEIAARAEPAVRRTITRLLAELPRHTVAALPSRATEAGLWPLLLDTLADADADVQAHIGTVWAALPSERRVGLQRHLEQRGADPRLAGLHAAVPDVSVEEVFFRRRQMRRRGPGDGTEFGAAAGGFHR
ncbi:hypothetical protein BJY24_006674 [Nocardia transvalensis]|uniref:Uncharacterized protein n=1 Tax=Nocardia transvalensis TaxID=37333 RepID=A0A7W9ULW4_9NOCA|nr:hypothetical protein [Nocardia transvalensis]MBB5917762.1 hypothetical protein [Nocardia transvalensis]